MEALERPVRSQPEHGEMLGDTDHRRPYVARAPRLAGLRARSLEFGFNGIASIRQRIALSGVHELDQLADRPFGVVASGTGGS